MIAANICYYHPYTFSSGNKETPNFGRVCGKREGNENGGVEIKRTAKVRLSPRIQEVKQRHTGWEESNRIELAEGLRGGEYSYLVGMGG